jgi:hypothetical protein
MQITQKYQDPPSLKIRPWKRLWMRRLKPVGERRSMFVKTLKIFWAQSVRAVVLWRLPGAGF